MKTTIKLILLFTIFLATSYSQKLSKKPTEDLKESKDKELILILEPKKEYDLNKKYDSVKKYSKSKDKKDSKINIDAGVDKETKSINRVKVDMGIKF